MKIKVTQRHIDKGVPTSPNQCPIALAMRAAKLKNPIVGSTLISWGPVRARKRIAQSMVNITQWRKAFDRGLSVKPFEFEI